MKYDKRCWIDSGIYVSATASNTSLKITLQKDFFKVEKWCLMVTYGSYLVFYDEMRSFHLMDCIMSLDRV